MLLQDVTATPHPSGNRIDLTWTSTEPCTVQVVRREGTHPTLNAKGADPTLPVFGVVISKADNLKYVANTKPNGETVHCYTLEDSNLRAETVYYYTLFPGDEVNPQTYHFDKSYRITAMATAPNDTAGQMYELLPGIYHRYDTVVPATQAEGMPAADMLKGQLRRFLDIPGGQLDWLYSYARALLNLHDLDKVDGLLLPLLAQWIGWETDNRQEIDTQRNEIRYAPDLYKTIGIIPTVESTIKRVIGWESRTKEFIHNVFLSNRPERLNLWVYQRGQGGVWMATEEPLSLDFAYDGRPAAVFDGTGTLWLFYHTLRSGQWEIWHKTCNKNREWTPSQPLHYRWSMDDKYPSAALQGQKMWVFWSSYDRQNDKWRINYFTQTNGQLEDIATFGDPNKEKRWPCSAADNSGGLWLFWLERSGEQWQMKYNRHDGTAWQLKNDADFPIDGTAEPRVESPPFVMFDVSNQAPVIRIFWSRTTPESGWQVSYRIKQGLDPAVSDWGPVGSLKKPPDARYQDREPVGLRGGNELELFWSSNRGGSWSIWSAKWDATANDWGTAANITGKVYSHRDPLAVSTDSGTLLFFHSNESLVYKSTAYIATETPDARYAGCTTVDVDNREKIDLQGHYEDIQCYSYDTGCNGIRDDSDWYAVDTAGIYLKPATGEQTLILSNQNILKDVLRKFMPITVRPIFIIEEAIFSEPQLVVGEDFFDSNIPETFPGVGETYFDKIPDWIRAHSWSRKYPDHLAVDFTRVPVDTKFRTWHIGLKNGG